MKYLCVFVLTLIIAQLCCAEPHLGVRALSYGGSYRARASSNDTIFFNPAGIIKKRRFSAEVDYIWEIKNKTHRAGASFVDSQSGAWGLGLAYNGRFVVDKKIPDSHLLYINAAMPIVSDMFALGVSAHYAHDRDLSSGYANFFNMNAGLLIDLPIGLSFGVVADNLIKAKGNEKDLGIALAAAFDFGAVLPLMPLSLSFDWLMDDVKNSKNLHHIIATGLQFTVVGLVPLRLGYNSDLSSREKLLSLGAGITSGIFAADALYQQNLERGEDRYFGLAARFNI